MPMELSEDLIVRTTDNILEWIDEKLKFVEVGPKKLAPHAVLHLI
jgi:hypothetical protein